MEHDTLLLFGKSLMEGLGLSGSFFYIDGNDNFTKPEDYSGTFETISGSIYIKGHKAGVYYSYSDTCFTIGNNEQV